MKVQNSIETTLICNNDKTINLKIDTYDDDLKIISIKMPQPQLIIKEINTDNRLYPFLKDLYEDFVDIFMNRNNCFLDPIKGWYHNSRGNCRSYDNRGDVDMYAPNKNKNKITFSSEDFYYELCPLKTVQLEYFDNRIELRFEIQPANGKKYHSNIDANEISFNSTGVYAIKRFETAYFFRFIIELVEGIINSNNNLEVNWVKRKSNFKYRV